jgi:hypothetical protein
LLRHFQRIVDFDAKIPNRAFEFCVTQKQLNGPEVLRAPIDAAIRESDWGKGNSMSSVPQLQSSVRLNASFGRLNNAMSRRCFSFCCSKGMLI